MLGPDFDAGNFGLDVLGIPGTNDQGTGDQRYAGYPVFNTGLSAVGNRDGWNPIFRDERTYSLAANLAKLARPARLPRRLQPSTSSTSITGSRKATIRAATSASRATRRG